MTADREYGEGEDPFKGASPLSEAQRAYLGEWLRQAADLMGLRDWEVRASGGITNSETSSAETFLRDNAREAIVAAGPGFLALSVDRRREVLAHELVHPHLSELSSWARNAVKGELGRVAEDMFAYTINNLEETATDAIGRFVAPFLPPFDLPE